MRKILSLLPLLFIAAFTAGINTANPSGQSKKSNDSSIINISAASLEVFMASWCPHCKELEKFLNQNHIPHKSYDIEKSAEGARRYEALGGGGVPLIKYGEFIMRGFDREQLLKLLEKDHPRKAIQT